MRQAIALLCNDLHITRDNIQDFAANWNEMLKVAKENGVEDIVIGGDIFTSMSSQTLSVLMQVKKSIQDAIKGGFYVTVANGNHDKADKESLVGYPNIYEGLAGYEEGYEVVSESKLMLFDEDGGIALGVMSYYPENGSFVERLEAFKKNIWEYFNMKPNNVVLYIHEGIHGALGNLDIPCELSQDIFSDFYLVLCGHYHNRVKVGKNIQYIGSSRQHNFGEDEDKGYTILYSDGSTKFIKNEVNTRYVTEDVRIGDIDEDFLAKIEKYKSCENRDYRVRVRVRCTDLEAENFDKQKLIESGASKIELVTDKAKHIQETQDGGGMDEKFDKHGILKEYQNFCDTKDIDSTLGVEYLNKI